MRTIVNTSKTVFEGLSTLSKKSKAKWFDNLFESNTAQAGRSYSSAAQSAEKAEQITLKEHGLSEILSESAHEPTIIGQTPVHSPLIPKLPEHYIEVEGQILEYPIGPSGLAKTYKITPKKPFEYIEIKVGDYIGPGKTVQFYNSEGGEVDALIKIPRTSKATREEYLQWLEDIRKNGIRRTTNQTVGVHIPKGTQLQRAISGLKPPKGTTQRIAMIENGNYLVGFVNKQGNIVREVKLNRSGIVMEYTNYQTRLCGQGIEGKGSLSINGGQGTTGLFDNGFILEKAPKFEEARSAYVRINESSRYILDSSGEVSRTIQTRRCIPHIRGVISKNPLITTVDTRSMGNGRFVEDIIIIKGDKRFSRSFWFDQRSGNVHQMDGWCKGFTKEEIELLKSDPFLASRFYTDGLDFVRAEKFNAYKTQGLRDKETPLTFKIPEDPNQGGHYQHGFGSHHRGRHINITPDNVINDGHSNLVNTIHHEPRHGFQHQMTEDFYEGLLEGEEKAQAEIFANNFANYKDPKKHGFTAYYEQPVEVDARRYGEAAQREFEEFGEKENHIFFNA